VIYATNTTQNCTYTAQYAPWQLCCTNGTCVIQVTRETLTNVSYCAFGNSQPSYLGHTYAILFTTPYFLTYYTLYTQLRISCCHELSPPACFNSELILELWVFQKIHRIPVTASRIIARYVYLERMSQDVGTEPYSEWYWNPWTQPFKRSAQERMCFRPCGQCDRPCLFSCCLICNNS
jgi:hypothetical protein